MWAAGTSGGHCLRVARLSTQKMHLDYIKQAKVLSPREDHVVLTSLLHINAICSSVTLPWTWRQHPPLAPLVLHKQTSHCLDQQCPKLNSLLLAPQKLSQCDSSGTTKPLAAGTDKVQRPSLDQAVLRPQQVQRTSHSITNLGT